MLMFFNMDLIGEKMQQNYNKKLQQKTTKFFIFTLAFMSLAILLLTPKSQSQSPLEVKMAEEEMRKVMRTWSRQLGVTCTTCHDSNNFKSDKLSTFKIGKEHMKLTQLLIDNGMDGKRGPKADCFMCHRGSLKPNYKEP